MDVDDIAPGIARVEGVGEGFVGFLGAGILGVVEATAFTGSLDGRP